MLGNHDNPRIASRVGVEQARVAAMLLLTLRGTPTMYYGDELGMQNVRIPPERSAGSVREERARHRRGTRSPAARRCSGMASVNAGFSVVEPWLPIADNYTELNVESRRPIRLRMLNLYRNLLRLRKAHPALSIGGFQPVATTGDLLASHPEAQRRAFPGGAEYGRRAALAVAGSLGAFGPYAAIHSRWIARTSARRPSLRFGRMRASSFSCSREFSCTV